MTTATAARALAVGPLAMALDARPVEAAPSAARAPERCEFRMRAEALGPRDREELAACPTARLASPPAAGHDGTSFSCERGELSSLARHSPVAQLLCTLLENAERPPAEPRIMGVINVTPDSFSDGGRYLDTDQAIAHGLRLACEGADLLDVGGESSRPGARSVPTAEELERVLPVIAGLSGATDVQISIDTSKAEVARAALDAGASLVNDISAGRDPQMLPLVAERRCDYVIMHMQGEPETMQTRPRYRDPVAEVVRFLRERSNRCLKAGIDASRIVLDPGIGFGKRLAHNLEIMRRLPELRSLGQPLLLGVSRKSFIAHVMGTERPEDFRGEARSDRPSDRLGGTAAALAVCVLGGADLLRVHDVATMIEAARVAHALALPARPRLTP